MSPKAVDVPTVRHTSLMSPRQPKSKEDPSLTTTSHVSPKRRYKDV